MKTKFIQYSIVGLLLICSFAFEASAQKQFKKALLIGQQYNLGTLIYKIERVKFKKFIGGILTLKKAHGEFLIVSITVKNNGKKQVTMDDSFFKLTDDSGAVYEYSPDAAASLTLSDFPGVPFWGMTINPNITKTGKAIFEVPSKTKVYNLILEDESSARQLTIPLRK